MHKVKIIRIISLFSAGMIFFSLSSHGQGLNTIKTSFDKFRKNDLPEKLFIHTDKNFFIAGEILWFKIYDIDGTRNVPFGFSKVAYVELLDDKHQPVLQAKVSLKGDGGGSVRLPLTIPSGNYILRAYTSWMKNFSPGYYFKKGITIVNTSQPGGGITQKEKADYEVQFFPEGGNLVTGIESEVGFRVVDQYGQGVNFHGVLTDRNKNTILSFKPFRFGMGHFSFKPVQGENYQAVLQLDNGRTIVKDLPPVYSQGYVMHVQKAENNGIRITVRTNIASAKQVYLIIHTRESVKVAEALFFHQGMAEVTVDSHELGEGISQVTVFNQDLRPVCERLYFRKVTKRLKVVVSAGAAQYGMRKRVSLSFHTSGTQHETVPADLSVSVYRIDSFEKADPADIFHYIWLTSDLRGNIQDPAYYFSQDTGVERATDNLMLTQGWRRFDWKNVIQQTPSSPRYGPETSNLVLSATVINGKTHYAAPGILTYLSIPGKYIRFHPSLSNKEGKVYFKLKSFYGRHTIVVETNTQSRDSIDEIKIDNPFSEKYGTYHLPPFSLSQSSSGQLADDYIRMQVQQAYHGRSMDQLLPERPDTVAFYGKPYKTYWLDDYTRYVTMEEVLREYVMEVALRKKEKRYHLQVMNALFDYDRSVASSLFQDDPLVFLDGVPVFNTDSLIAFNPLKVQKIEVVAGRYFYGPVVADGVVSFTTYKGDMDNFRMDPHAVFLNYDGLQRQRIFYAPDYGDGNHFSSRIPDFRSVLYWSPEVHTDKKGNATCSFYTSDLSGRYVVVVGGITLDGEAGSGRCFFSVK